MLSNNSKWGGISVLASALLLLTKTALCAEVDAKAEVAAALYTASATQAAAERIADTKLHAQRKVIEELQEKVRTGVLDSASLRAELTKAEEGYIAELGQRDRAYSKEIAVFRAAVQDIAATPEGAAALARFNAGDEPGALAILDDLREARRDRERSRGAAHCATGARRTG
jgi:hypothetical protein